MELPVIKDCNRCGECCIRGGNCLLRPMAGLPEAFNGRCEILTSNQDGTTTCYLVDHCVKDEGQLSLWAAQYIDGKCSFPELRKEIDGKQNDMDERRGKEAIKATGKSGGA